MLFLARLVFNVQVTGSFVLLVFMCVPFIMAALSLGLLISAVAKTQGQALQMALLTLLPSILLSGYISPRETLPGPLWVLSNSFPVTHFITIARGIIVCEWLRAWRPGSPLGRLRRTSTPFELYGATEDVL